MVVSMTPKKTKNQKHRRREESTRHVGLYIYNAMGVDFFWDWTAALLTFF